MKNLSGSILVSLLISMLLTDAIAQPFEISNYTEEHYSGEIYSFPIVKSSANAAAARSINEQLQKAELEGPINPAKKGAFENMWPHENQIGGTSGYAYEVLNNNERYFSVSFSGEGCGAYCEGFENYYNFDAHTGALITVPLLLSKQGLSFISHYALYKKNKTITDAINSLTRKNKSNPSDAADNQAAIEMYQGCRLAETDEFNFDYAKLMLSDSAVTIKTDGCSNHAMAALDEVGDFVFNLSLHDFKASLSSYGMAVLNTSSPTNSTYRSYTGTLNNTIKITAFLSVPPNDQAVQGMYFYNRVAGIIKLQGSKQGNTISFTEADDHGIKTGQFELTLMGNTLTGKWINPKTLKELPVVLKEN